MVVNFITCDFCRPACYLIMTRKMLTTRNGLFVFDLLQGRLYEFAVGGGRDFEDKLHHIQ